MTTIKFIDLFAGIGGFRQALLTSKLKGVKFEPVGACEIDNTCQLVYKQIFKNSILEDEVFMDDVQKIYTPNNLNEFKQEKLPSFNLLLGGFPCQPFSNVGARRGLEDPRGALIFDIIRILGHHKPNFFVLENVSKISTIEQGNVLQTVVNHLEDAGYHVHLWDLYADNYGLPQRRRRVFFCGVNKEYSTIKKSIVEPEKIPQDQWKYPTTWHLLEKKMDPVHIIPPKTRQTVLRKNPKWQGNLQIDRSIARPITASMAKWHRANQDNYFSSTYLSEKNPDPTISPEVDLETEIIRRISPLEGFRLQGFPDEYAEICKENKISFTATYRMIGNAVPVDLARSVIDHFLAQYLN